MGQMLAWITDPTHPHYPECCTLTARSVRHPSGLVFHVVRLSAAVFHGVHTTLVPANALQPVRFV